MCTVTFETTKKTEAGTPLTQVLKAAPFKIPIPCGKGKCGKCLCIVRGSVNPPTERELKLLKPEQLEQGYRLACEVVVEGDAILRKPPKKKK